MSMTRAHVFSKPISLRRLALVFFGLIFVLLSLSSAIFFANLSRLESNFAISNERLARQELSLTLELIDKHLQKAATDLAQWDETKQQLADPTYYAYWRNTRVMNSGLTPQTIDGIELYDANGNTLSRESRVGDSAMPPSIAGDALYPRFEHLEGHDHIVLFKPVYLGADGGKIYGYVGVKVDFLDEVKAQSNFRYTDLPSLTVIAKNEQSVPISNAIHFLSYRALPNPEVSALKALLFRVMVLVTAIMLGSALLAFILTTSLLAKPLQRISEHIDKLRTSGLSFLSEAYRGPVPIAELENVCQSLNDYQLKLEQMHVNLANKNEELWKLAHHDPLTGVHNRRAFEDDWGGIQNLAQDMPLNLSFMLFDCDHFKTINDTYGHHIGDKVIQGIAECLHRALRTGDRLYRLGGDEFATILYETDADLAMRVATRCTAMLKAHDFAAYGIHEPVTISIGIAHGRNTSDALLLHKQADLAMYHAKRPGNAKISLYDESLGIDNLSVFSSPETNAVYAAITQPEKLEMHYQKIVHLQSGTVDYYEALVRIPHPQGLLSPASIFGVVEAKRLETEFDLAVLERIRMDMEAHLLPHRTGISVNVSGISIVNSAVMEKLLSLGKFLRQYKIVIEVTETSLITQIGHASINLNRLRKAGFVIALDDFGSGYSSLRYLSSMPVDVVKFDISMVRCLESEDRQKTIVENLAQLIRTAGFHLIAEGIESEATLQRVKALGFSHAQGFHLGRPERLG